MRTTSVRRTRVPATLVTLALVCASAVAVAPGAHAEVLALNDQPLNFAVVAGDSPELPAEVAVSTSSGDTSQAAVSWDLAGTTFSQPYKSYTIYGDVAGVDEAATATVETLADDTVYFIDSAVASSAAFDGAKNLLGDALRNDVPDQPKASDSSWGYAGQDGSRADAGTKGVNGHYGYNGVGNSITYTLDLPDAGEYTLALGLYEWWSASDRQIDVTVIDSLNEQHAVVRSASGDVSPSHRESAVAGTFELSEAAAGEVTVRISNVGWQGASVTWLAAARGAQELDLAVASVEAPVVSPSATVVYGSAQTVSINAADDAVVFYTLDGSAPTRTSGTRYSDPFLLDSSATVRALAFRDGVASAVTTVDYTIAPVDGEYESVPVGQPWFDTEGNSIQAHGGGFLEHDGAYYWVGEDKAHNGASFNGTNLYRSEDLLNWQFVTQILVPEASGLDCNVRGAASCKVERPKLLFNETTDAFVLWGHWETADSYAASEVVVATSPTIDGDYEVKYHGRPGAGDVWDLEQQHAIEATIGEGRYADFAAAEAAYRTAGNDPLGHQSRDFTVYVDSDRDGWLISAEAHEQLRVYPLSADYENADFEKSYPLFSGESREAAAITQVDGTYYLVTSGQSGWYANQLKYATTSDLSDPNGWSENHNLGNNTTFKSQPAYVVSLPRSDGGTSLVYMGDRWVAGALATSTYVWLPLDLDPVQKTLGLEYTDEWSLDVPSGQIEQTPSGLLSQGKPSSSDPVGSLSAGYSTPSENGETLGSPAAAANDGIDDTTSPYDNSHYFFPGSTSTYSWQVDLQSEYDVSRADISWRSHNGSESYSGYVLSGSTDGENWTTIADRTSNRQVGFTSDALEGSYRFVRVDVNRVINDHNGNEAAWAAGIVEVQIYGDAGESPEPTPTATPESTAEPTTTPEPTASATPAAPAAGGSDPTAPPLPATSPDATGSVSVERTAPGVQIDVSATGFRPGERVDVWLYSTPVLLAAVVADSSGAVSTRITIPADAVRGDHHIVLIGAESNVTVSIPVQVVSVRELAVTGSTAATPRFIALLAAIVLVAGVGFSLSSRRRVLR
ncbi:hypothetical protein FHX48_000256 [Microbacterium halimionae]|uniref:F5/8 type C domain-containing protein n=1 Tax=Microbacterium halimionae TaxID=1526413 RepID=A0A7W3PKU6_9MICO|nr:chitobiase/beta-hexosaminidase C-terminal domain-containing protein [Microbacterium halimionae]MBA8815204.1 hypothetical protein [Microbacterium halimionae]NII94005.1 hypothetical protein [Microbacterium halimionae]